MSSEFPEKVDVIIPKFARDSERVNAYFSLKNASRINRKGRIPGLNIGFNTVDSDDTVEENRLALFEYLDLDPDRIARGGQVHSNRVRFVTAGGLYPETDGLVTAIPGLTLAVQVADCAAVLMVDKENGIIAAVHAGWRGAVSGILDNALQVMRGKGANPSNLEVYLSPCISLEKFEVGEEVARQFPDEFVDRVSYRKPHVDLKRYLAEQLVKQQIPKSSIEVDNGCTYNEADRFYSYRREGQESGRMFAFVRLS